MGSLTNLLEAVEAGTDTMPTHTACYKRDKHGVIIDDTWNDRLSSSAARGDLGGAYALMKLVLPEWGWDIADNGAVALWPPFATYADEVIRTHSSKIPSQSWLIAIIQVLIVETPNE